ncbi:MAG: hypothetical protein RL701_6523 [Pseudomonadota bacterium]
MTPRFGLMGMAVWLGSIALVVAERPAAAQFVTGGEAYALLVGSNDGGPGQNTLRYAEADTARVADVLTDLGGYPASHVQRLLHPSAAELLAALERVRDQVEPLSKQGVQSRFFFYYSGHARADGLNLGDQVVPLPELRKRIEALPATLSIVVLDACQSGAFSRPRQGVKGAARAADFSFNSVERLNTAGMAVIASSNERELSQESDVLRSSYFTHHWLVGLRGGGDHNQDGRVTLSEAYQYAYNHTLANTAQTAVGEQHATLETNLRGQDDIALTQPSAASSWLRVPAAFQGRLLLQAVPSWTVLAELDKVPGEAVVLGLPAGDYSATLRYKNAASRCSIHLQDGREFELDEKQCTALSQQATAAKGEVGTPDLDSRFDRREWQRARREAERRAQDLADRGKDERLMLDLSIGFGTVLAATRYTDRLRDFCFQDDNDLQPRFAASLGYRFAPHLVLGLAYYNLSAREWSRRSDSTRQNFAWTGHAFNLYGQADVSVGRRRMLTLFSKLGVGASVAWTSFDAIRIEAGFPDSQPSLEDTTVRFAVKHQYFVRPNGFLSAGVQLNPARLFGLSFEVRYVVAPAIKNDFGEHQSLGGFDILFGVRLRTWE